jgi:hypothetical protein
MTKKDIRTSQVVVACDVCGRRLLRGEKADVYLAGGVRRSVCELCITRAEHEGWIREAASGGLGARRPANGGRRALLGRWRRRGDDLDAIPGGDPAEVEADLNGEPGYNQLTGTDSEPRHVHAVPANDEMKLARAVEMFNASPHRRTIAGLSRSLGPPAIVVRTRPERPSVVSIVVAWELSWYRYEADLGDEASGVRLAGQGSELTELEPDDQGANAAAADDGELALAA